nr:MAG TPA: hypothetical protein [Caudoviricetes sp.]
MEYLKTAYSRFGRGRNDSLNPLLQKTFRTPPLPGFCLWNFGEGRGGAFM